jgi:multiple sugar transport system substrate-binding protein
LSLRGELSRRIRWVLLPILAAIVVAGCAGDRGGGAGDAGKELTPKQREQAEAFGLDPDKPYAGTELNFLICCHDAPQFADLAELSDSEFEELTGISVKWGNVPFGSFQQRVVTEATTGGGTYDIVAWVDSWGPSIRSSLVPLNDKIQEDNVDMSDFPPAFRQASMIGSEDGTYYGMPLRGHAFTFFYRTDIYEELGMEPPKTWTEFVEQGEQIKQNTDLYPTSMYYSRTAGQNVFMWLDLLWGNGSDVFDENYRPIFNNEEGVEATELYIDFLRQYEMTPPASETWDEVEGHQAFSQNRAATFMGWSWLYSLITSEEAVEEVRNNVGFTTPPVWEGKEPITYGYLWPVGILRNSQNQDAAWEYLKWMTHPDTEKQVLTGPEPRDIASVHLSNLRDEEVNELSNGLHRTLADVLGDSRTTPMIPEWPEVQEVLSTAISDMAGGADVEATLDDAATQVERIMEREGYYD